MTDLPDDFTGLRIRYRTGMESRSTRVIVDRGKKLDTEHGEVKRSAVIQVLPDPRPYTGPGPVQPPRHERPDTPIERSVREVAERVRPRADKQRARKSRSYLDHVKSHACCFAYMGNCRGPMDPHHFPPKRNGDGFGSDYQCAPLCRGHHDEVTDRYCVGPLTRAETEAHVLGVMNEILAKYVMRWEAA